MNNTTVYIFTCTDLEKPWENIGRLAPDDKKARVELAKAGVQIFQTLQEEPEEGRKKLKLFQNEHSIHFSGN